MAATAHKNDRQEKIKLTVALDGEYVELEVDPHRTFGYVIRAALDALAIDEQVEICHLAVHSQLYLSRQRIEDTDVEDGLTLHLRLPL